MANTLKIKRGTAATIPQGQLAEPLFTTDTYDLYIGKGSGGNQRIQNYIASGISSQFLKGDGTLDSTTYQATSEKGANNGYASLDSGGKVPASQLPNSIMDYLGTWNASTNTPTLADGTGNAGDVYICSVGGTQNLGSGSITFAAGDWVVYSGSVWQKSINSNAVASVNGQTGIVSIGVNDLDDATITSPSNGQLLQYSTGTNKWVNWTPTYISAAITSLNGLTAASQTFAVGTSGTDFAISSSTSTHTFNLPDASASARGVVTTATQTFAGNKTFSDLLYGNQHIYFGMSTGADYYVRTPNVSTSRRGLFLSNGVNTDLKVYAGGTQTLGAWTESDTTLVIGTGYQGGGGSNETILFHSTGIGNLMALTASSGGAIYAYRNIILPANNTVGGTNYCIEQQTASNDGWRLYGNTVANDQAEMVFELYDNAQSWGSNGQRYRFYFNPQSGGIAKNVLIMDYDTAVFTTSVTATSIIRSGGTSSQFLKADGSVDSNTYLTTSSAASTYVPYTGATTNVNIGTNSMTAFNFYASSTYYIDSYNYFMKSILELRDNATSTKRLYITADTSESLISTVNTVPLKLRATSGVTEQVVLNTNGTINFTGAATFSSSVAATSLALNGSIANSGDAATLTIKQSSTTYTNGIYLERGGERNGYYMYIGNSLDSLTFRRNYFGTQSDVMSLTRDGNVGIGTTSPGELLHLSKSTYPFIKLTETTANTSGQFGYDSPTAEWRMRTLTSTPLTFGTNDTERMRITSDGAMYMSRVNTDLTFADSVGGMYVRQNGNTSGTQEELRLFGRNIAFFSHSGTRFASITSVGQLYFYRNSGSVDVINIESQTGHTGKGILLNMDTTGNALEIGGAGTQNAINVTSSGKKVIISNLGGTGNRAVYSDANGTLTNSSSDFTLKTNIENITYGLNTVLSLKPVSYNWIPEKLGTQKEIGFIAQEVQQLIPEVIGINSDETLSLDYPKLTAVLVKAIQEQQAQIEELKSKLN